MKFPFPCKYSEFNFFGIIRQTYLATTKLYGVNAPLHEPRLVWQFPHCQKTHVVNITLSIYSTLLSLAIRSSTNRHHSGDNRPLCGQPLDTADLTNETLSFAVSRRPSKVAVMHRILV
jgi:hypothetical protein